MRILGPLRARPRLGIAIAVVIVTAALLPGSLRVSTRLLVGWDVGAATYLALLLVMVIRSEYDDIQRRADQQDPGAATVLLLTVASSAAGLVAIGAELHGLHDAGGGAPSAGRLSLAGLTILISWFFAHAMFGLHYAHDYYVGKDDRGGLKFPDDDRPDYWDFMYFAFTMGAAAQTSDVEVTAKRMRRFVLAHTIVAFLFNTTILALAINVGASLL